MRVVVREKVGEQRVELRRGKIAARRARNRAGSARAPPAPSSERAAETGTGSIPSAASTN